MQQSCTDRTLSSFRSTRCCPTSGRSPLRNHLSTASYYRFIPSCLKYHPSCLNTPSKLRENSLKKASLSHTRCHYQRKRLIGKSHSKNRPIYCWSEVGPTNSASKQKTGNDLALM